MSELPTASNLAGITFSEHRTHKKNTMKSNSQMGEKKINQQGKRM